MQPKLTTCAAWLNTQLKPIFGSQGTCFQLSSDQNPGYQLYIGDYTTQLYWDCNEPL